MSESNMSKKAAIAGMGITAIAASSDINAQIAICAIASLGIIVQAIVETRGYKAEEPDNESGR